MLPLFRWAIGEKQQHKLLITGGGGGCSLILTSCAVRLICMMAHTR
jgi:hypothetical protein